MDMGGGRERCRVKWGRGEEGEEEEGEGKKEEEEMG